MKQYPEIPNCTGQKFREFDAYVFDKIDGSNLRFEWNTKQGWYKFGTRHRLFDRTDEFFGEAVDLFRNEMEPKLDPIVKKLHRKGILSVVVYTEFAGENSFAGQHVNEPKKLYLFDVALYKKGLMSPAQFLDLFGDCNTPKFLGRYKWTRSFVEQVREGKIPGVTFEGVVGKSGEGHELIMAKAKTQQWLNKVKALYSEHDALKIINS